MAINVFFACHLPFFLIIIKNSPWLLPPHFYFQIFNFIQCIWGHIIRSYLKLTRFFQNQQSDSKSHPANLSSSPPNLQSKEILLNLSMKCWNSAFSVQGLRLIVVVIHVGAVNNIYVAAVGALRKKERQVFLETEALQSKQMILAQNKQYQTTSLSLKSMVFWVSPFFNVNVLFLQVFFEKLLLCVWPNSGFWCWIFLPLQVTLITPLFRKGRH